MDKNVIIEEDVLEVTDTETLETQVYTMEDLYKIIKEQSEKIAELTQQLAVQFELSVDSDKYHKLWEENQQLKKRVKDLNLEAQKYYEDAYCNDYQNQKAIKELNAIIQYIRDGYYHFNPTIGHYCADNKCVEDIALHIRDRIVELGGDK